MHVLVASSYLSQPGTELSGVSFNLSQLIGFDPSALAYNKYPVLHSRHALFYPSV